VRDRVNKTTMRVNVGANGEQAISSSNYAKISANGKVVAFTSDSFGGTPGNDQVWLRYLE
jgi:hypothetical protein